MKEVEKLNTCRGRVRRYINFTCPECKKETDIAICPADYSGQETVQCRHCKSWLSIPKKFADSIRDYLRPDTLHL